MYLTATKLQHEVRRLNSRYWNEGWKYRWEYMSYVIGLLKSIRAKNILEAGCNGIPLKSDSYQIELDKKNIVTGRGRVMDLNETPYSIPDKNFDAAVALQVWEHLDNQTKAFQEFCRISKHIILSFPYKWNHGDDRHRGIDEEKIAEWTCNKKPISVHKIKTRIVYFW